MNDENKSCHTCRLFIAQDGGIFLISKFKDRHCPWRPGDAPVGDPEIIRRYEAHELV